MNIFTQIAEVVKKLFSKSTVEEKIGTEIAVSQDMLTAIKTWSDCYMNKNTLSEKYGSMRLPTAVAHEIARLATLELHSELTGGKRAEFLSDAYSRIIADAQTYTEYACAKGGLMLKPYVSEGGRIAAAYIQADSFFPTAYDSTGSITGCVFVERKVIGRKRYTKLEIHSLTPSVYTVKNRAYMSESADYIGHSVPLASVPEWSQLSEETSLSGIKRPLYAYFKMPGANCIDSSSPLGVSVYANALDAIRDADEQYARLMWEFEGSELAINADITALDNKGTTMPKLDKRLYRGMDLTDLYEVFSPSIRDVSIINGLNTILRNVEMLCGLAYGTFSKVEDSPKTATEIKSSRQRSYSTVSTIQKSLKSALIQTVEVMEILCDLYRLAPKDKVELTFEFDDSLVTDSESEQKIWLQEVAAGIMTSVEYRMKRYGETEEQAAAALPQTFEDE